VALAAVPAGPAAAGDAVVLHRAAHRHHLRRHRRDLRRVRRRDGRPGHLHEPAEELVPHRSRARRRGRHRGALGDAVRAHLPRPAAGDPVAPARLTVEGLTKAYGDLPVLDGVSFTVGRGEFVAVIGPSGCGKSTLFDVVAGLEPPDDGRVLVDGVDVTGRTDAFAYMPQQDLLF